MRADAQEKRRALVDAAWTLFARRGVTVSLRTVAERAGVGIGTLYRHFPTREDLVVGVVDEVRNRVVEVVARHRDGWDDDAEHVWRHFAHTLAALEIGAVMYQLAPFVDEHPAVVEAQIDERRQAAIEALDEICTLAKDHGLLRADVEPLRVHAGLAAIGRPLPKQAEPLVPHQRSWLVDVFLDGLQPRPPAE